MKKNYLVATTLLLTLCVASLSFSDEQQDKTFLCNEIQAKIEKSKEHSTFLKSKVETEKQELLQRLQSIKNVVSALEKEVAEKEKLFEDLKEKERTEKADLENEHRLMTEVQTHIHGFASDIIEIFHNNPTVVHFDNVKSIENKLKDNNFDFSFEDFKELVELLFSEMREGGSIKSFETEVVTKSGKKEKLKVLRIGTLNMYVFDNDGKVQIARISDNYNAVISPMKLSWFKAVRVKKYLKGGSLEVPVDVSGTLAYINPGKSGIYGWFKSGGPIMWPLLLIALASLAITIERWLYLRKLTHLEDSCWKDIIGNINEGNLKSCISLCKANYRNPVCRIIEKILTAGDLKNLQQFVDEVMLIELQSLERFLPTLTMLAAVAPLLGLLGTVSGIIETFQSIALFGAGNPRYLSGGISEALVTTQFGLMIAVPVIIIHHILEKRVDSYVLEIEEKTSEAINKIIKTEGSFS